MSYNDIMKKIIIVLTIIMAMLPISLKALSFDDLYSDKVLIYDMNEDKTLYEKNTKSSSSLASLTKIMTAIVSIEKIDNLDEKITVTEEMLQKVPWDASKADLEAGDVMSYRDLLYALMLPSGADAAYSLAILTYKNEDDFVLEMNKKAKQIGMTSTIYDDPTGYLQSNTSTVEDLKKLMLYALKNSKFKEIFTTKYYLTTNEVEYNSTLYRYGKNLGYSFDYAKGTKTGFTDEAGLCLVALIEVDGEEILSITMGAEVNENKTNHLEDLNTIYNKLSNTYKKELLYSKDDVLYEIKTKYAKEKSINIHAQEDITMFTDKEFTKDKVSIEYDGINKVKNNIKTGTKIGTLKIKYEEEVIKTIDVVVKDALTFSFGSFVISNIPLIILVLISMFVIYVHLYCKINHKRFKIRIN